MAASPVGLSVASASPAPASPGKALPGWRIRWFWRWQAWRLRKAHSHEASHGVALYDSVHALDHLGYVDDFCELHAQLMRESPLLGCDAPVNILTASATVRRIVNMTALTVMDANSER